MISFIILDQHLSLTKKKKKIELDFDQRVEAGKKEKIQDKEPDW